MEQVVLEHVAQNPHTVIIICPVFDIHRFSHRNLDIIHIAAIPDRLEYRVGEAEKKDVLSGLLTQIVVNTIDLALIKYQMQNAIQISGKSKIPAKGFFYNDPAPALFLVS